MLERFKKWRRYRGKKAALCDQLRFIEERVHVLEGKLLPTGVASAREEDPVRRDINGLVNMRQKVSAALMQLEEDFA